ncbi:hypothetical protein [Escherichia coli]
MADTAERDYFTLRDRLIIMTETTTRRDSAVY